MVFFFPHMVKIIPLVFTPDAVRLLSDDLNNLPVGAVIDVPGIHIILGREPSDRRMFVFSETKNALSLWLKEKNVACDWHSWHWQEWMRATGAGQHAL